MDLFPRLMEHLPASHEGAVEASLAMVEKCDIYLGILGYSYGYVPSGSEISIFEMEYNHAKERGLPCLIFLMDEGHQLTSKDFERGEGRRKLEALRERLRTEQVVSFFDNPDDLVGKAMHALKDAAERLENPAVDTSSASVDCGDIHSGAQHALTVGKTYEVAILSWRIAGYSDISQKLSDSEIAEVFTALNSHLDRSATQQDGNLWMSSDTERVWAFCGPRRCDKAVLAGISALNDAFVFNLDSARNTTGHTLELYTAAGHGAVAYHEPTVDIVSRLIKDTVKLQKERTRRRELLVTQEVQSRLDSGLKTLFPPKGYPYLDLTVYPAMVQRRSERAAGAQIIELVSTVKKCVSQAKWLCRKIKLSGAQKVSAASLQAIITEFYGRIERFRAWMSNIDENWSVEYFEALVDTSRQLKELDAELYRGLLEVYPESGASAEFRLMMSFAKTKHADHELGLTELGYTLSGYTDSRYVERTGLITHIRNFVAQDDLDRLATFIAINRNKREDLVSLLGSPERSPEKAEFLRALWSFADLILIEDWYGETYGEIRSKSCFEILSRDPSVREIFGTVAYFLGNVTPLEETIKAHLAGANIEPTAENLGVIWRSVVANHKALGNRYTAALNAPLESLWQIVVYPRTPMVTILVIAKRLVDKGSADLKKIFFDCVRSRILRVIHEEKGSEEIKYAGEIIDLFFGFELFAESDYFAELEILFKSFKLRSQKLGSEIDLEGNLRKISEQRKHAGGTTSKVPEGVGELPKAVQRHLAREGCYVEIFACSADARIAKETRAYINNDVLRRIARYCAERRAARGEGETSGEETGVAINEELLAQFSRVEKRFFSSELETQRVSFEKESEKSSASGKRETALDREMRRKLSPRELEEALRARKM